MMKRLLTLVALFATVFSMSAELSVSYTIDEITTTGYKITFTPNEEVAGYAACQFDAGTAEQQFAIFGAWMGFTCIDDMVKSWGFNATTTQQMSWTGDTPGKNYEVYVAMWDASGAYGTLIVIPITTLAEGGEGVAEIEITLGDFGGNEETGYYQWVTYTPNDQVNIYHDMLIEKSTYETSDWGDEGIIAYLTEERPSVAGWDMTGIDEAQWNADPDTEYIAFALGKNALGEWGPLARLEFKTPGITGISTVSVSKPSLSVKESMVTLTSMKPGCELSLYDLNGRLVGKALAGSNGEACLNIGNLNNGVYIVTDGTTTYKFVK